MKPEEFIAQIGDALLERIRDHYVRELESERDALKAALMGAIEALEEVATVKSMQRDSYTGVVSSTPSKAAIKAREALEMMSGILAHRGQSETK